MSPRKHDFIQEVRNQKFKWVNVTKPGEEEIGRLGRKYRLLDSSDLRFCLPPLQRPRLIEHQDYLFLILLYPVYRRKTKEIHVTEIDFFIHRDFLITVHSNDLPPLINLFNALATDPGLKKKHFEGGVNNLLYEILNVLSLYCFPILNTLGHNIDDTQRLIFSGHEKKMVRQILKLNENIIDFRKALQAHKSVIRRYAVKAEAVIGKKPGLEYHGLVENIKDVWDALENHRETVVSLQKTNESLIGNRINEVMKTLTIISVIILPLNLIASFMGMNVKFPFGSEMPIFWTIVLAMSLSLAILYLIFKRVKWL